MEESKTYFADINENEKRVINLMRTYMAPRGKELEFVDSIVSDLVCELYNKAVRLKAFVTVMEDSKNKNKTPIEIISLVNKYTEYLREDKRATSITQELIMSDIVNNLEGKLKPACVATEPVTPEALEAEKSILDKISN